MKIVIIQYNAGNTTSLYYALKRLGFEGIITTDKREIESADKVLFPGQGEAFTAMRFLKQEGLDKTIANLRQPVLGICLGMHLLCEHSEERDTTCLNIVPTCVKKIKGVKKLPQMGWNKIYGLKSLLLEGVKENSFVYYANSFVIEPMAATIGTTFYGHAFSACIAYKNFYGIQFHPEKSGLVGEQILMNFLTKIE